MAKCKVQIHLEIGPVSAVDAKGVAVVVSGGVAAMRMGPSGHTRRRAAGQVQLAVARLGIQGESSGGGLRFTKRFSNVLRIIETGLSLLPMIEGSWVLSTLRALYPPGERKRVPLHARLALSFQRASLGRAGGPSGRGVGGGR